MQQELYKLYCDPYTKFDDLAFDDFNVIETFTNDVLPMSWFSYLNGLEDTMYLAFSFARHKSLLHQHKLSNAKKLQLVTREAFRLWTKLNNNMKEWQIVLSKSLNDIS